MTTVVACIDQLPITEEIMPVGHDVSLFMETASLTPAQFIEAAGYVQQRLNDDAGKDEEPIAAYNIYVMQVPDEHLSLFAEEIDAMRAPAETTEPAPKPTARK